jgi:ABC-2 type transport system ATP-binding protein
MNNSGHAPSSGPLIGLYEISKWYGQLKALDRLTIEVRPGEIYGLLGPNGAGKTTALSCLAGLSRADNGRVRVAGLDVLSRRREAAARLALIPDRPHLPDRLTVMEVGEYSLGLRGAGAGEARRRFTPWLRRFGLEGRADTLVSELSHGMRQKVVFSTALAAGTEVLVIDEPMVGLDVPAQRLVLVILREKADSGCAVLVTTHTLAVAQKLCTRVGILDHGRLLEEGAPEELSRSRGRLDLEEVFLDLLRQGQEG